MSGVQRRPFGQLPSQAGAVCCAAVQHGRGAEAAPGARGADLVARAVAAARREPGLDAGHRLGLAAADRPGRIAGAGLPRGAAPAAGRRGRGGAGGRKLVLAEALVRRRVEIAALAGGTVAAALRRAALRARSGLAGAAAGRARQRTPRRPHSARRTPGPWPRRRRRRAERKARSAGAGTAVLRRAARPRAARRGRRAAGRLFRDAAARPATSAQASRPRSAAAAGAVDRSHGSWSGSHVQSGPVVRRRPRSGSPSGRPRALRPVGAAGRERRAEAAVRRRIVAAERAGGHSPSHEGPARRRPSRRHADTGAVEVLRALLAGRRAGAVARPAGADAARAAVAGRAGVAILAWGGVVGVHATAAAAAVVRAGVGIAAVDRRADADPAAAGVAGRAGVAVAAGAVVETDALSLAGSSSAVSVVTLAPFVIGPEVLAVTSIRTVAFAPGAMSPRVQTTVEPPLQLPWLGVAERYDTEPGSGSRRTTLRAAPAPRLSASRS